MNADYQQAKAIFLQALEMSDPIQWPAFLDQACAGQPELRRRVGILLEAHREAGTVAHHAGGESPPLEAGAAAEQPGVIIGSYKLIEQIGEGGMGTVWMAQQTEPVKRVVALKLIKAGMDSKQVIARFEAERQALALMEHPNIARVLDAGTTSTGRPYFVMDLVKGVPITKYCDEHHLTPRQRLELFISVCQAVQHAHQKGIIHRDLKPSNVLVAHYDGKPVPKIIDFGVAKAAGQSLTDKTLVTGFGNIVGTLEYMSPEQAEINQLDIDTRSDIYSLGVLLYELLAGSPPFSRKELEKAGMLEMLRVIREQEPSKPSTKLSTAEALPTLAANRGTEPAKLTKLVRGELDWIVMKALEKDRNRRYETANGFAMDVQRYLADEAVLAGPPSAWYRLRKFARRNRSRLAVAVGVFLAVLVMTASIGWAWRDRAAQQAEAELRAREVFDVARTLIAENKLIAAREKLAAARAHLANNPSAAASVAAEIEAAEAELSRLQQFQDLIDRGRQTEIILHLGPTIRPPGDTADRRTAEAAHFRLKALDCFAVLQRDDWNTVLEEGLLGRDQVEQVRRIVYEELLWLAADLRNRQQEHQSGQKLTREAAARQALIYLGKAESAHRPTQALYEMRARCREALGEEAAAKADRQLADKAPPTVAADHYQRGMAAYLARELAEGVQAFEAALRLEPTHYWSLMGLGYCLCDLARGPEDLTGAARVFTGCILKRPDHAHAYQCRGHANRKLGQYDKAAADYSKAIDLDPKRVDAWNNRGTVYCDHLGEPAKAVADFTQAIKLDPKFTYGWFNRGNAYGRLGQHDKAAADYSKAIDLDPKYVSAWYNRGLVYSDHLGEPAKAVADFTKATKLDPKDAKVWSVRGSAYGKLGQHDKAADDFTQAVKLDPKDAKAWYARGVAYAKLDQPDKAVADCTQAIKLDPTLASAWANRGIAYAKLRQHDKAVADYSKAIELDSKLVNTWYNRGLAYVKLGQADKAVADFTEAIKLDATHVNAWCDRGLAYVELGQHDKAIADYSKVIDLDSKFARAWRGRGTVYTNHLRQHDKAVEDYTQAIKLDSKDAITWYNRGSAYDNLRQHDKAVADFTEAIKLDSKFAAAWYNRGVAYNKLNQLDKAVADFTQTIALNPNSVDAWYNRGVDYVMLGQHDKAIADFESVLKLAPTRAGAQSSLAWLLATCPDAKRRDANRAVELAKSAVKLAPMDGLFRNTLGVAHYRAGDWNAAVAALNKSVELRRGGDASDHLFLAMAYWKLGKQEESRKAYNRALQWLEKNKAALAKNKVEAEEFRRFHNEAEAVLELKKK